VFLEDRLGAGFAVGGGLMALGVGVVSGGRADD
jgi:hypothetical protein